MSALAKSVQKGKKEEKEWGEQKRNVFGATQESVLCVSQWILNNINFLATMILFCLTNKGYCKQICASQADKVCVGQFFYWSNIW